MTLKQIKDKVDICLCLHGQFNVIINYRGKEYTCKSNNTMAYDTILTWKRERVPVCGGYTIKKAYEALWDECKRKNGLK